MGVQKLKLKPEEACFVVAFKKVLLDAIQERELSAYYMHTRSGISHSTFLNIFRDPLSIPSILTLKRLASALKVPPENLIGNARREAEKLRFAIEVETKAGSGHSFQEVLLDWYERQVRRTFEEWIRKHNRKKS